MKDLRGQAGNQGSCWKVILLDQLTDDGLKFDCGGGWADGEKKLSSF